MEDGQRGKMVKVIDGTKEGKSQEGAIGLGSKRVHPIARDHNSGPEGAHQRKQVPKQWIQLIPCNGPLHPRQGGEIIVTVEGCRILFCCESPNGARGYTPSWSGWLRREWGWEGVKG